MCKAVKIEKGNGGWGGPLVIEPTETKNKVVSITGWGIAPVARKIAELTGAEAVDGFSNGVADEEMACVVINCGGTLRCGVYPKKGVMTVNLTPVGQSGTLAQFIKEDIYVSVVTSDGITMADGSEAPIVATEAVVEKEKPEEAAPAADAPKENWVARGGKALAGFATTCVQGAKEAVDISIKDIIPFMAFYSLVIGLINFTGLGGLIGTYVYPYLGTLPGLLVLAIICGLPILSPLVGSSALIGQLLSVIIGYGIMTGTFPVILALPAFFAVDVQVGCDFIPVGLSMGDAANDTVDIGVPSVLLSRIITGPIMGILAFCVATML
ncbi:PTS glucitol/sorbitol transporter subunit IIB [Eubacterium aggregans]|uniref:PTS glucitol/sorbitol transporter subunit IIB n=1 Tax=Eubacterium aggregans TaxID=81409 RepID=UPI003F2CEED4